MHFCRHIFKLWILLVIDTKNINEPFRFTWVRVSPFCLPYFADVIMFTSNFYPLARGKPWSTRKRQTGVFCLLFVIKVVKYFNILPK
jgi:hypothetical protein